MRNTAALISFVSAILLVASAGVAQTTRPAVGDVRVETIDARVSAGALVSMTAESVTLKTRKGVEKISLADLSDMTGPSAGDPLSAPGRGVVATADGNHITAAGVAVAGGKVSFTNTSLGKMVYDFGDVSAVYLPAARQSAVDVINKCAKLNLKGGDQDLVVVAQKSGHWLGVQGVLKTVDATMLTFTWKGADRQINLSTVRAVFLATTGAKKAKKFTGVLTVRDGSSVRLTSLTYDKQMFGATLVGGGVVKLPLAQMSAVKFVSDRVMNLSDMKPQSVKQHGLLDTTMSWRTNRSVGGGAITLGGRNYSTGLGLHSFCELTYALDAQYKTLIAIIGIDDAIRPGGEASLTFLGDGKELLAPLRV
ncbi:MAG: hypothetical protein HN350_09985, partial [Phycisphaerales bacterium]|nr:hypothetical protein [Phycisphaerales bacterium]